MFSSGWFDNLLDLHMSHTDLDALLAYLCRVRSIGWVGDYSSDSSPTRRAPRRYRDPSQHCLRFFDRFGVRGSNGPVWPGPGDPHGTGLVWLGPGGPGLPPNPGCAWFGKQGPRPSPAGCPLAEPRPGARVPNIYFLSIGPKLGGIVP